MSRRLPLVWVAPVQSAKPSNRHRCQEELIRESSTRRLPAVFGRQNQEGLCLHAKGRDMRAAKRAKRILYHRTTATAGTSFRTDEVPLRQTTSPTPHRQAQAQQDKKDRTTDQR